MVFKWYGIRPPLAKRPFTALVVDPDIYYDVQYTPDPIPLWLRLAIANNEGLTLYFKAAPSQLPSGWSMDEQTLGSLADGGRGTFTVSLSRSKPSIPFPTLDEDLIIRISAYRDDAYTDLYGYIDIPLTAHGIDSDDPNWTVIKDADFDDGTTQGFEQHLEIESADRYSTSWGLTDGTYVSPPYSLEAHVETREYGYFHAWYGAKCSYDASAYSKAFVAFCARRTDHVHEVYVESDGMGYAFTLPNYDKWYRAVTPIKPVAGTLKIYAWFSLGRVSGGAFYLDDVKIIAV